MREHLTKLLGVGAAALVVGALVGASLGRADAASARRYGDAVEDARVRELEQRLADASAERDSLREENEELARQLRAAAPGVDLGGAVTRLQDQLTSLRGELEGARGEARQVVARAEQELSAARATAASAQAAAEREVAAARGEVARWRQAAADAQGQVEPLRQEVADLRQQVTALNETIKALRLLRR